MNERLTTIPWHTPDLWQEANSSLDRAVARNRRRLIQPLRLAGQLRGRLQAVFPRIDDICRQTCPQCTDICCQRAWVWADFRDLLFYHLAGIPVPERQLLGRQDEHCRYASPQGCRLDRLQRPFVCTWYLCPVQTRLLAAQPALKARIATILEQVKKDRRRLEACFIRAVAG